MRVTERRVGLGLGLGRQPGDPVRVRVSMCVYICVTVFVNERRLPLLLQLLRPLLVMPLLLFAPARKMRKMRTMARDIHSARDKPTQEKHPPNSPWLDMWTEQQQQQQQQRGLENSIAA